LTAIKLFAVEVAAHRPDLELVSYQSISEACESLAAADGLPWLLVTDINLPATSGTVLISWIRRHPRLHGMPIAVVSAATESDHQPFAATHGVIRWVAKPATSTDVKDLLHDRERMEGSVVLRETLEREFVVSGVQALEGILNLFDRGGDSKAVFHALHSFKGEAAALLFPDLAKVAHALEINL
jgi:CheY-like chemotaxis protein